MYFTGNRYTAIYGYTSGYYIYYKCLESLTDSNAGRVHQEACDIVEFEEYGGYILGKQSISSGRATTSIYETLRKFVI